jgi:uncharacterized protein (TIGR03435 family)
MYRKIFHEPSASGSLLMLACWVLIAAPCSLRGETQTSAAVSEPVQAAQSKLEVVAIKPVKEPDPNHTRDTTQGRRLIVRNTSLRELITMAYELDPKEIEGDPKWLAADEWNIDAEAVEGVNLNEVQEEETLLQEILADRFRLAFHWEKRTLPVYVLTVTKPRPKLQAADPHEDENSGCPQPGICTFRKRTLSNFAWFMQYVVLDKPVVDKTGIAGEFDFLLKWTPDESQFSRWGSGIRPSSESASLPSLFTAIQEQLGLKLESVKAPVNVLVIDHVEKPTEN